MGEKYNNPPKIANVPAKRIAIDPRIPTTKSEPWERQRTAWAAAVIARKASPVSANQTGFSPSTRDAIAP
jgi:hypothetical protein